VKVLLDENLDRALRKLLGPHEVVTVTYTGWGGIQNGALLRVAEESGFDGLPCNTAHAGLVKPMIIYAIPLIPLRFI
jgi:hypothetical protein